jgi:hypothetical protein
VGWGEICKYLCQQSGSEFPAGDFGYRGKIGEYREKSRGSLDAYRNCKLAASTGLLFNACFTGKAMIDNIWVNPIF